MTSEPRFGSRKCDDDLLEELADACDLLEELDDDNDPCDLGPPGGDLFFWTEEQLYDC